VLETEELSAGYGQVTIVHDVSLRVQPGSIVAVLGPNGSGKSTLLKAMVGIIRPMTGHVRLDGCDVAGWRPYRIVRQGIGYVPQTNNVFVSLSVVENLEMGAYVRAGRVGSRVEGVLELFPDLRAARKKKAGSLSVGQRNLLGLARALMLEPRVILVDEPTAGLAPANCDIVWNQLRKIAANGTGVLVVEQQVDMAVENSDWCCVLTAGRKRLDKAAADVRRDTLHELFLGHRPLAGKTVANEPSAPQAGWRHKE
jgi:branched-chain amino acid transport system ATP-binding protein